MLPDANPTGYTTPIHWLMVQNTEAQVIPPHAVLHISGVTTSADKTVALFLVQRPTADNQTGILLNGPSPIPPNGTGQAHMTFPAIAAYDTGTADIPAVGDTWGPASGSYYLKKGKSGFLIAGGASAGRVNVVPAPPAAAAGGSITIRRTDYVSSGQSYLGTTLQLDPGDPGGGITSPWTLTQPVAGVVVQATINPASPTRYGIVSTNNQSFSGTKTFSDGIVIDVARSGAVGSQSIGINYNTGTTPAVKGATISIPYGDGTIYTQTSRYDGTTGGTQLFTAGLGTFTIWARNASGSIIQSSYGVTNTSGTVLFGSWTPDGKFAGGLYVGGGNLTAPPITIGSTPIVGGTSGSILTQSGSTVGQIGPGDLNTTGAAVTVTGLDGKPLGASFANPPAQGVPIWDPASGTYVLAPAVGAAAHVTSAVLYH
jgi:hypothetical protein